jgi:hypothetical protein
MSCDSRSLPDDHLTEPFKAYIYREIERATGDSVVIPFYAFLAHRNVKTVEYETDDLKEAEALLGYTTVQQSIGIPYYLPNQGLPRLWKVSALKAPNFDWSRLDKPIAIPDAAVKIQLVSYAYAHWNELDIVPPATTVEPLTEANDDGWRMRNLISKVRPIASLPYGSYQPPSADAPGDPGPWAGAMTGAPPLGNMVDGVFVPVTPPTPTAATAGLLVPLYDAVFRINLRDGVWYANGELGNVPMRWDNAQAKWVPTVPPEEWHDTDEHLAPGEPVGGGTPSHPSPWPLRI